MTKDEYDDLWRCQICGVWKVVPGLARETASNAIGTWERVLNDEFAPQRSLSSESLRIPLFLGDSATIYGGRS